MESSDINSDAEAHALSPPDVKISPLSPVIGAEISGFDLSSNLDALDIAVIRSTLLEHQVVFFREQQISLQTQIDFALQFGRLHLRPAAADDSSADADQLYADTESTDLTNDSFHSEVSCEECPPLGSILRLETAPASGGDMLFVSMYAAFEALSDTMQNFLSSLSAVHEPVHLYRRPGDLDEKRESEHPGAIHPLIRTHPETGRHCLYVNSTFTRRIVGMKQAESDALLGYLFAHIRTPEFQCRFQWQPDSIAFWDNRCTQRYAMWDYPPQERQGYRVTIQGDRPFFQPALM